MYNLVHRIESARNDSSVGGLLIELHDDTGLAIPRVPRYLGIEQTVSE
jgi:hypothetical protein